MIRWERIVIAAVLLIAVGVPVALALPAALPATRTADGRPIVELVAHAPEMGGWSPEEITIQAGQSVRLRLRAEDVAHGFVVAGLGIRVERIEPGKVQELDLQVDRPGRYPFYCDVWCGPQHYRMRGTLVVVGPDGQAPELPALSVDPRLDPDAPHEATDFPAMPPAAAPGAAVAVRLGPRLTEIVGAAPLFQDQSPEQLYLRLRAEGGLSAEDTWALIAYLWNQQQDAAQLERGRVLYARNCAVCHGVRGQGNGPAAKGLPKTPADFTDLRKMTGVSDATLRAKIIRGGMGTGMPYWGRLFNEEETQALLSYLRSFSWATPTP